MRRFDAKGTEASLERGDLAPLSPDLSPFRRIASNKEKAKPGKGRKGGPVPALQSQPRRFLRRNSLNRKSRSSVLTSAARVTWTAMPPTLVTEVELLTGAGGVAA